MNSVILTPILRSRAITLAIIGAVGLQTGLVYLGLPGWPCPLRHAVGLPCPGCGLTRAVVALLHGDWEQSFTLHAFAPVFLAGMLLVTAACVLPQKPRDKLVGWFQVVEYHTWVTTVTLIGLMLYWLVRLLLFPATFIQLINAGS